MYALGKQKTLFSYMQTRRERLKSALYLRLKQRKVFEIVKGGLFGLFENPVCCKISKKLKGDPLETVKKIRKIVAQCRKNSEGAYSLVRFCILRLKWSK